MRKLPAQMWSSLPHNHFSNRPCAKKKGEKDGSWKRTFYLSLFLHPYFSQLNPSPELLLNSLRISLALCSLFEFPFALNFSSSLSHRQYICQFPEWELHIHRRQRWFSLHFLASRCLKFIFMTIHKVLLVFILIHTMNWRAFFVFADSYNRNSTLSAQFLSHLGRCIYWICIDPLSGISGNAVNIRICVAVLEG